MHQILTKTLVLAICLLHVNGELCGQPPVCHCISDMGILACINSTIQTFPTFSQEEKADIILVDIAYTKIPWLPVFNQSEWPLLKIVDLRTNDMLDCENRTQLVAEDVTLVDDCPLPPPVIPDQPITAVQQEDHMSLILSSAILTPSVLIILAVRIYLDIKRRHLYQCAPETDMGIKEDRV